MTNKMKRLIVDLDNTITLTQDGNYASASPIQDVIDKLIEYKKNGFEIVISSSRNMRTFEGNIGKMNIYTLPTIIQWLNSYNVPYDEIYIGKPWCGHDGFYIDDRAIRPDEFTSLTYEEIRKITKMDTSE
ncbi:TPA: HAD-IIIC family phosphatase [Haemophilus influenzae]